MAINQASILNDLETLVNPIDKKEFIFGFLTAYGYSKTTITRLRSSDGRNLAAAPDAGEVAFKKGIYFKPVIAGNNIYDVVDHLRASADVARNNIRFVLATDWVDFVAYDLKTDERLECLLTTLPENYTFFLPLAGFEKATIYSENPADVKAAEQMGRLFDLIKEKNQSKTVEDVHALNVFLTRLLFCFFAEDTGIFELGQMSSAVASFTSEDGSDLSDFFNDLFEILNEKDDSPIRKKKPAYLKNFPYVNGGLFKRKIPVPEFGAKARRVLLDCSSLKWAEINPDIFGSMFQSVIDEEQRGSLGQHYTSVTNIMKVIQPLFLDKLEAALEDAQKSESKLKVLLDRISKIKIFDPACGSGNFLIIAYKELRKIEMAVFKTLGALKGQSVMPISGIKLSQFYGIEIDDFAHEIALLSLWLTEHQMNQVFKGEFGNAPPSLPLNSSGNITRGNSLRMEWLDICPRNNSEEVYLCGNPPFLGFSNRNEEQQLDMDLVFNSSGNYKKLDYVACWYKKSSSYIQNSIAEVAFVATKSIYQGEQVGWLWSDILNKGQLFNFAYLPFKWKNNAQKNAQVYVCITGISCIPRQRKYIHTLIDNKWHVREVSKINPYLTEGETIFVEPRRTPLNAPNPIVLGSSPKDGGHLIFSTEEKNSVLVRYPNLSKYFKKYIGTDEFLYSRERWCLWLRDYDLSSLKDLPVIGERLSKTAKFRLESTKAATRESSKTPHLFDEDRQMNDGTFLLVPYTTSENRTYLPMGFFDTEIVVSNLANMVIAGGLYDLGILSSSMCLEWMRAVGGRLENRVRFSGQLVYNTFPWPILTESGKKEVEKLAEKLILIRESYPAKSLADLYDAEKMPAELLSAHKALDLAVDKLYQEKPFKNSFERLSHLFTLYEKLSKNPNAGIMNGGSGWLI
jgi:type I restriction-modification system DNA methylase subunit